MKTGAWKRFKEVAYRHHRRESYLRKLQTMIERMQTSKPPNRNVQLIFLIGIVLWLYVSGFATWEDFKIQEVTTCCALPSNAISTFNEDMFRQRLIDTQLIHFGWSEHKNRIQCHFSLNFRRFISVTNKFSLSFFITPLSKVSLFRSEKPANLKSTYSNDLSSNLFFSQLPHLEPP